MKDKKHKYLEDLFDEYIVLQDEQIEVPVLIEKAQKKFEQYLSSDPNAVYKQSDAEDLYKIHSTLKKHEERKNEISQELAGSGRINKKLPSDVTWRQGVIREKDDDKSKLTFLFWLKDDKVILHKG